jgi:hypothetical protein
MTDGLILTSLPEMSIKNQTVDFRFSALTQFIAKHVITPKSGWTDGGGLTRLHNI